MLFSFCFPFGHLCCFHGRATFHRGLATSVFLGVFLHGLLHGLRAIAVTVPVHEVRFGFHFHFHFFLPFGLTFFAVFALSRNASAVGAPLLPGFRMRSPDPDAMRSRLAWMLA